MRTRVSGIVRRTSVIVSLLAIAAVACDRRAAPGQPSPAPPPVAPPVAAGPPVAPAAPVAGVPPVTAVPPVATAAPDVTPPDRPRDLEAIASPGAATLTWTGCSDDTGVEGYEVYRDDRQVARVARPGARVEGLRAGERSCFTVVGFDAAGNRSERSAPSCVTAPDVTPPSAPGPLTAALAGPVTAQLRWTAATDDVGVTGYEVLRGDAVIAAAKETQAHVGGLAPGRRHCFAVRAVDAAGNRSPTAGPACVVTPDLTAPTPPGELRAEARPGRVELRWEASRDDVGVVGYEVQRDGAVLVRATATAAADANVRPSERYCYLVLAVDAAGNRSTPAGPVCATPPDVTPPTRPTGVTARGDSETSVRLGWSASSDDVGVVRYELLREGKVVANVESTEATVNRLRVAVEYCHTVRACDAAGNCSAPSEPACATTPDLTPPTVVAKVSAEPVSDRSVAVRWTRATDNVGVVRYEVLRGGAVVAALDGETTTTREDGLSPAQRYCYSVVALDAAGHRSHASAAACAVTPDLVAPTIPAGVIAAARSGTQIVVAWNPSKDDVGVAGYEVLRAGRVIATVDHTQASVTLLDAETEYCHAIRAFDAAGNRSPPSGAACAKTATATSPTAPWNVRAETTPRREVELTWDPSPDPNVVYVVYWDGTGKGEKRIGTTAAQAYTVNGKAAGEMHCYRVAALDDARGESPRSFPACAVAKDRRTASAEDAGAAAAR